MFISVIITIIEVCYSTYITIFCNVSVHDSSSSPGDTLSPTTPSHHPPPPPPSSSGHRRSSSSSSSSRPSLADDINAIRLSLEGASSNAREKILKILERLTSRLAVAESERDTALSKFNYNVTFCCCDVMLMYYDVTLC